MSEDIALLEPWRGRSQTSAEVVSGPWLQKLQHTLDRDASLGPGDPLPPLWHFCLHLPSVPLAGLGPDGHPERGGFLPPVRLPRRMWAAGRFEFVDDIRIGDEVTKTSTIEDISVKSGRSGPLCFVTVGHVLDVGGAVRVVESQSLVYRGHPEPHAPAPVAEPAPAPESADWTRTIDPSEVLLFRYSALTFNAHRIHYDRDYARDVEGYEGLVVHGPLTATLLADLAVTEGGRPLAAFSFRALAPLFDTAPFTISGRVDGDVAELWASGPAGGLAMTATAQYR